MSANLLPEMQYLCFGEPSFEEGARVDAGRRVPLDHDEIAAMMLGRRMPEMHEACFIERGCRLVARNVAAQFR